MSVTGAAKEWTYEDYASLPDDGNRYEVLDGEVFAMPSPGTTHQRVATRLFFKLHEYVAAHQLGEMIWDIDLLFQQGQFLRPDMLFVPAQGSAGVVERGVEVKPGLVVEVLSQHSKRIDRIKKPPRYRDFGVPEYWVVDPFNRCIERHRLIGGGPAEICREVLTWQPEPNAPALEIDVQSIFPPR